MVQSLSLADLEAARAHVSEPDIADHDIDPNDVMSKQCTTCPWKSDRDRLELTAEEMAMLTKMVLSEANIRCHHAAFSGKAETKICRGARNLQLKVFHSLGVLDEPTDACWSATLSKISD